MSCLTVLAVLNVNVLLANQETPLDIPKSLESEILDFMEQGNIPGLSLVMLKDGKVFIKGLGYADEAKQKPVTTSTLFQLGSTSKAFTALAVTYAEHEGLLSLQDNVSDHIPWFQMYYKDSAVDITIRQLVHHTSGIPWNTIAKIPQSTSEDALEVTVRKLKGQELKRLPGEAYEYATTNYDILAYILQKVSGMPFETYLQSKIIDELGLEHTTIGTPKDSTLMAHGYKSGFLTAREYNAPQYKGNNAAAYIISNAEDISTWLRFQMGLIDTELYQQARATHERDESVAIHGMSSYARGWQVSLDGSKRIFHSGLNPNFSSYISFIPEKGVGVAVLANANSNYTSLIGERLLDILNGESVTDMYDPGDGGDKVYTSISIALIVYLLVVFGFLVRVLIHVFKGQRKFRKFTLSLFAKSIGSVLLILPFLYAIYILPEVLAGFSWQEALVWTPFSFGAMVILILCAISLTYVAYFISLAFPESNLYKRKIPSILLMSILSGLSNVVVIILVTSFINSDIELKYLFYYYALTIAVYLLGRRFVQVNLIRLTRGLVYDLRVRLVEKIFSTSYDRFEKMDRGRVYTALNDDVNTIGGSTSLFIGLITSVITAIGAFVYLASLAFWATVLTIFLIISISLVYYLVSQNTNKYFEQARDSRNVFMRLINGMIDGYKEISMRRNKKIEYKTDVEQSAQEFRDKISIADIKFTNAFLVGESLLVVLLGLVSIGMSEVFPSIESYTIMSFVVVLLYLIGPVNGILNSVPNLMHLKIAWNRVQNFIKEIPANLNLSELTAPKTAMLEKIEVKGICYQYKPASDESKGFKVGPIDFELNRGEIIFIIGGNGSGKTTLAKMITGLYTPDEGEIKFNGQAYEGSEISEHFSSVFSPPYLFDKLYNINTEEKEGDLRKYLSILDLDSKVDVIDNKYSTTNLSSGQRKRLALLQCYLEDSEVYLFDEWAADQDPEYRKFFYRTLLPEMKNQGKLIIAITHDDHYFDVADKVLKMNNGKLEAFTGGNLFATV